MPSAVPAIVWACVCAAIISPSTSWNEFGRSSRRRLRYGRGHCRAGFANGAMGVVRRPAARVLRHGETAAAWRADCRRLTCGRFICTKRTPTIPSRTNGSCSPQCRCTLSTTPLSASSSGGTPRWGGEEAYKRIKHRLELEHTSGQSWHAARQDFGAKAVFDNLNALAAYVATEALIDPDSSYKVNRTLAIDKIKRQIGRWLFAAAVTPRRFKPLLEKLALNLQKFVPNRPRPRKPQPKPLRSHAFKRT